MTAVLPLWLIKTDVWPMTFRIEPGIDAASAVEAAIRRSGLNIGPGRWVAIGQVKDRCLPDIEWIAHDRLR